MSDHEKEGGPGRGPGSDAAPRGSRGDARPGSGDGCKRAQAEAQATGPAGPGPSEAPPMGWGAPGMAPPPWAAGGYPPPGYGAGPWGGYVPFPPFPPFAPPMAPPPFAGGPGGGPGPGPGAAGEGLSGGGGPGGQGGPPGLEGGYGPPWANFANAAAGSGAGSWAGGVPGLGPWLRDDFTRGLLVGAAAAYMVANPKLQQATISSVVKAWNAVQGGFSELRERFRDAEAELDGNGSSEPDGA